MLTHTLGFPRIGKNRKLKRSIESYWKKDISPKELADIAGSLRREHWQMQSQNGIDLVPAGDFSFYDQILDLSCALGAIPPRFDSAENMSDLDRYFLMARGDSSLPDIAPMEMTKWFDTNYHYIVPEFYPGMQFKTKRHPLIDHIGEAKTAGFTPKAVLPGPVTFMALGKAAHDGFDKWELFDSMLEAYCGIVADAAENCEWIQIDEPLLVTSLAPEMKARYEQAFNAVRKHAGSAKILLACYFDGIAHNLDIVENLPVDFVHIDCVRAPEEAENIMSSLKNGAGISLGLIDGRNIWRADLDKVLAAAGKAVDKLGSDRIMIAPSCPLLHVPIDIADETALDCTIQSWLAFAVQKCRETGIIRDTLISKRDTGSELEAARAALWSRQSHPDLKNTDVRERMAALSEDMFFRSKPYSERKDSVAEKLELPLFPTTTIGSFPQTGELRRTRRQYRVGKLSRDVYESSMKEYIEDCIRRQEELGLDVLVHGEAERNDMVEYFGEQFDGFCFTEQGWVQSYGTRCVKPPIIYGDVSRPEAVSVDWIAYASSLTDKPVKGMLTGPVTILAWSFERNDQSRRDTCLQIALALRDEVMDLEKAGISVIQIDEPAFREIAPIKEDSRQDYYRWAAECFRLASAGVADSTQIHTHMCYCEFNEIVREIASLDADVISIEASRSNMELLDAFRQYEYPNEIGPGVYDIHSPRVPSSEEMVQLLEKAAGILPPERLWINPDCGLKTRTWDEVMPSLRNMIEAAHKLRAEYSTQQ